MYFRVAYGTFEFTILSQGFKEILDSFKTTFFRSLTKEILLSLYYQAKELSNEDVSQAVKRNEDKILEIGKLFQQRGDAESLGQLVKMVRPYLGSLSKEFSILYLL